jgi:hypothetical protein
MSTPRRRRTPSPRLQFVISVLALATVALATACGSGSMSTPSSPVLSGNTQVTLVLSGTANDQLTEFDLGIEGISLTSQSGKMVSVLSALQGTEFIHTNGGIEPPVTVNIPQEIDNFSALAVGTFVTVDGAIQPNGSLVAKRIAVEDTTALQMMAGPLMQVSAGEPALVLWGRQRQGTGEDVGGGILQLRQRSFSDFRPARKV